MSKVVDLDIKVGSVDENGEVATKRLTIKIGNKENVVVGGPALGQRFPVTLYAPSWLIMTDPEVVQAIRDFIMENQDALSWERK